MASILIVDNERSVRLTLGLLLKERGHQVREAASGEEALELVRGEVFDLAITDLKMAHTSGMDVLRATKAASSQTEVIVLTGHGTIESAVEAMRLGAFHYVTKPYNSQEMLLTVEKALERHRLVREVRNLREQVRNRFGFESILGKSPQMQRLLEQVAQVARTEATVLIEGESGTGKELIARAIHGNSARAEGPFVPVNCAALPESLLESELFGHIKGAFTGAGTTRKGLFEEADRGTILLDEIGDTTLAMQAKLLRVLQDGEIRRVGSSTPIRVDVRVLAATNKSLQEMVRAATFREDLFYRLNVVSLRVLPLRERREDIVDLAHHFLKRSRERQGKPAAEFNREALELLQRHPWPGNVRELENAVERGVVLCPENGIRPEDLPPALRDRSAGPAAGSGYSGLSLRDAEREHILTTLRECHGNQAKAAELLGIGRNTLWRKLKEYGVKPADEMVAE